MQFINVILICISVLLLSDCRVGAAVEEEILHEDLFSNYNKNVPPRRNVDDKIYVTVSLILRQVASFDERRGMNSFNNSCRYLMVA